jgi:hypothetical protein
LPPTIALNTFPSSDTASTSPTAKIRVAWNHASNEMFRGKFDKADAVGENFLNHVIWYATTSFTRPYPGETKVLMPGDVRSAGRNELDRGVAGDRMVFYR